MSVKQDRSCYLIIVSRGAVRRLHAVSVVGVAHGARGTAVLTVLFLARADRFLLALAGGFFHAPAFALAFVTALALAFSAVALIALVASVTSAATI